MGLVPAHKALLVVREEARKALEIDPLLLVKPMPCVVL
jgi:hypothetical protein